jgi:hypothetical protein
MATLHTITPIALAYHAQKIALELLSPPGVGKTTWMRAFCQLLADRYEEPVLLALRHLSIEAPEEIAGVLGLATVEGKLIAERTYPHLFPQPYDPVYFPHDWSEDRIESWRAKGELPKRGIIGLDEFRQADEDAHKVAARLIDEGRLDRYDLADLGHYSCILCSNRAEDKSGTGKPMAFITNRKGEIGIDYNVDSHCEWMFENGISAKGIAFARAFPKDVHSPTVPDHDLPFVTPRSFVRSCLFLQELGVMDDRDVENQNKIAVEGVAALMGEGAAAVFMGFLRRVEDMIPIEEIKRNPNGCRVPDRPDVMWAVIQMMTQYAADNSANEDMAPFLTYMLRFGTEFQTACIRMMVKSNRKLFMDKRYSQWVRDHRDLVMNAIAADNAAGMR